MIPILVIRVPKSYYLTEEQVIQIGNTAGEKCNGHYIVFAVHEDVPCFTFEIIR